MYFMSLQEMEEVSNFLSDSDDKCEKNIWNYPPFTPRKFLLICNNVGRRHLKQPVAKSKFTFQRFFCFVLSVFIILVEATCMKSMHWWEGVHPQPVPSRRPGPLVPCHGSLLVSAAAKVGFCCCARQP